MNVYMTEEEQVEAIKRWWTKYGTFLMWAVAILLLLFSGYQWLDKREKTVKMHASESFQRLMYAASTKDESLIAAKISDLKTNFQKTVYKDVAFLLEAKEGVAVHDYEKAITALSAVINSKQEDKILKELAKIRLARVYGQTKESEKALALLKDLEDSSYAKEAMELKGDILLQMGDKKQALLAYTQAVDATSEDGQLPYLRYKLDSLKAVTS